MLADQTALSAGLRPRRWPDRRSPSMPPTDAMLEKSRGISRIPCLSSAHGARYRFHGDGALFYVTFHRVGCGVGGQQMRSCLVRWCGEGGGRPAVGL